MHQSCVKGGHQSSSVMRTVKGVLTHLTCRASVLAEAASKDLMYDHPLMKPYIFFDVSAGRESRQGTGSLRNQVSTISLSPDFC